MPLTNTYVLYCVIGLNQIANSVVVASNVRLIWMHRRPITVGQDDAPTDSDRIFKSSGLSSMRGENDISLCWRTNARFCIASGGQLSFEQHISTMLALTFRHKCMRWLILLFPSSLCPTSRGLYLRTFDGQVARPEHSVEHSSVQRIKHARNIAVSKIIHRYLASQYYS